MVPFFAPFHRLFGWTTWGVLWAVIGLGQHQEHQQQAETNGASCGHDLDSCGADVRADNVLGILLLLLL